MQKNICLKALPLVILLVISSATLFAQDIKIGFRDSIESKVLNEYRRFIVKLPEDYNQSDKSYPVLYRLDGDYGLFLETVGAISRLVYMEELMPDMVVVMIENTNRNRDMMPTNTFFFQSDPGAENFKAFFEEELIPHVNRSYRTSDEKILCGQSLSSIFTLYYLLTSPDVFDSYIASSAGFPDCEDYFIALTTEFLKTNHTGDKKVFLTYGAKDFLDPDGLIKAQLDNFTEMIKAEKNVVCGYKIYEDEGHVPYPSLYDGLRFIYK
jgi:predicted alpha/beta superfamily hydrolase